MVVKSKRGKGNLPPKPETEPPPVPETEGGKADDQAQDTAHRPQAALPAKSGEAHDHSSNDYDYEDVDMNDTARAVALAARANSKLTPEYLAPTVKEGTYVEDPSKPAAAGEDAPPPIPGRNSLRLSNEDSASSSAAAAAADKAAATHSQSQGHVEQGGPAKTDADKAPAAAGAQGSASPNRPSMSQPKQPPAVPPVRFVDHVLELRTV